MQALIDFDGWRKWKDFSQFKPSPLTENTTNNNKKSAATAAGTGLNAASGNGRSPKAGGMNGKMQAPLKRDREKLVLGLGKENSGSGDTGTGNDTTDSGSGMENK